MSVEHYQKWLPIALALDALKVPTAFAQPLSIIAQEGEQAAIYCKRNWKAARNAQGVVIDAGLELAKHPNKPLLQEKISDEILELCSALSVATGESQLAIDNDVAPSIEGQQCLSEMRAVYGWVFDDGVEDDFDRMLSNLGEAHAYQPTSNADLAMALEAYALFGDKAKEELTKTEQFDANIIPKARGLARKLRERGSSPVTLSEASREALDNRNRLVFLLEERVQTVRGAARFVFRMTPERSREAASAYDRKRRNARKRDAQEPATPTPVPAPVPAPAPAPVTPGNGASGPQQ